MGGILYKQDHPYLKMSLKMVGWICGWILEPSRKPRNPTSGGAPPNPQSDAPSLVKKRYFRQGRKIRPKSARDPPANPSVNPPGPVDSPGLFPCTVHLGPPGAYQAQPWRSTCHRGPSRAYVHDLSTGNTMTQQATRTACCVMVLQGAARRPRPPATCSTESEDWPRTASR